MIKILTTLVVAVAALSGCATAHHDTVCPVSTVTVDRPIVIVPAPPDIPVFVSEVDALSPNATAGEVATAYVQDTYVLRSLLNMHVQAMGLYRKLSSSTATTIEKFNDIKGSIDHLDK